MMPDRGIPHGLPTDDAGATARRTPPQLHHILRSFLAVVCGVLIFTALVAIFNRLAGVEVPPRHVPEKLVEAAVCAAVAMLATGYLAARIAGRWEILVGTGVGVLMSIGAGRAQLSWQGLEEPVAQMVSVLCLPPFALLGSWAARQMAQSEARKRAEELLQLPVEIRQLRAFVWLAFFLSVGMTAAAAWAIKLEPGSNLPGIGVLFFGLVSFVLAWQGIHNKPQAVFRDEGVEFTAFHAVIPWSEIIEAAPHPFHPVAYVRLQLVDPQKYLSRLSPLQTAFSQTGESEPNIGIALTGTPYTVEQIVALVRSRARGRRL